jgi:ABC-type glycerol-3-phosphate transport system substrate-binding protein
VTVRVLASQQPWEVGLRERATQFEKKTGAKVEFDLYSVPQAVQKVAIELSSRSRTYDLVFMDASDVQRFSPGGFLEPLSENLKNDSVFDLSDFIPSTINAFSSKGEIYGVPHFAATQILYYRGDLLKQAGLSGPPKTFAEYLAACSKLQSSEVACSAMRGKPDACGNVWYWTQIFLGYGGSWVKKFPDDLTPTVSSDAAVEALNFYLELMKNYSPPGIVSADYDDVIVAMQQGRVAMAIEGAPLAGRIVDPKLSKFANQIGFAKPPGGPAGTFAPFTAQGMSVNAASAHKDAAIAFLKWATSKETMLDIAANSSVVAVNRNSVWQDPRFRARHGYDNGYGSFTEAYAATLEVADKNYRLPLQEFRPMCDRVALALQEAAVGKRSPRDALDAAQNDILKQFKRAKYIP